MFSLDSEKKLSINVSKLFFLKISTLQTFNSKKSVSQKIPNVRLLSLFAS